MELNPIEYVVKISFNYHHDKGEVVSNVEHEEEITRCKNCKFFEKRHFLGTDFYNCVVHGKDNQFETYANEFCSLAEKR